jgi:hypothetical protein
MGQFGMAADQPRGNGLVQLVEMASKEMVSVFYDDQLILIGQRGNEFGNFALRAMLIVGALHHEYGLPAIPQIRKVGVVEREAQTNQIGDTGIGASNTQANPAPKTEAGEKQRGIRKFSVKKTDGGLHVPLLALAAIV